MNVAGNTRQRFVGFRRAVADYVFLAPYLVLFIAFMVVPLGYGFGLSLFRVESLSSVPPAFAGVDNYAVALHDPYFFRSLCATLWFTALSLTCTIPSALTLALLLAGLHRRRTIYRAAIFFPTVVNVTVAGIVWRWLFSTEFGLFNHFLLRLGLPPVGWLTNASLAMPSVMLMTLWWTVGGPTITLLAGLLQIPSELYEAAELDGAGAWRRFWHVTLPQLRPVLTFVVMMNLIGGFQMFGQAYVMSPGGGPDQSTRTLVQYIYEASFENYQLGYGAAMSWLLFLVIAAAAFMQWRLLRQDE